ncbi:MAG: response regulator transcription factor [Clostridia bacterium]|nr:response regulator transcription factor [Clostridia bacterium]
MRKYEINKLNNLRIQGYKPTAIARELGISVNTIKAHIRRHPDIPNTLLCEHCGKPVLQHEGRKAKRFCNDKCRMSYWNKKRREGVNSNDSQTE